MEEARKLRALNIQHIMPAVSARTHWYVTAPEGTQPEDLLVPEYWKNVSEPQRLQPNDRLDATCEDGTWFAEYLIVHTGPFHAKLQLLGNHPLDDASEAETSTLSILGTKWKGPAHKHVVFRVSDGETLKHGFVNKNDAIEWMAREVKNITAAG